MREVVNTWEVRPTGTTVLCARCGGHFINETEGRRSHAVVFGHSPEGLANVDPKR